MPEPHEAVPTVGDLTHGPNIGRIVDSRHQLLTSLQALKEAATRSMDAVQVGGLITPELLPAFCDVRTWNATVRRDQEDRDNHP